MLVFLYKRGGSLYDHLIYTNRLLRLNSIFRNIISDYDIYHFKAWEHFFIWKHVILWEY